MSKSDRKLIGMIVEGRNLAPKDPNGLSDPFLLFGPVDKKGNWAFTEKRNKPLKSSVLRKTLNPMWRMPFELFIDTHCKAFKIEVWDWDLIGNDFMGLVTIPLSELPKGRESENWYKLLPRNPKKDVVTGEILVRIMYMQESALQGGMISSAIPKRLMEASASSGSSLASSTSSAISEEEYSVMDDMRTGEIDLVVPALFRSVSSIPCLQIGLPALGKWATTASVAERIALLEKHQEKIFELLLNCATEFKLDSVVVFYAVHSFGPFLRLYEAKQYFTSKVASLLANSLQAPPMSMKEEDRTRHLTNCLISLANACTANLKEVLNNKVKETSQNTREEAAKKALEATDRCIKIVASSGALGVALQLFSDNIVLKKDITSTKHLLALIIKIIHDPTCRQQVESGSFITILTTLLSSETDPVAIWLALDTLTRLALPVTLSDRPSLELFRALSEPYVPVAPSAYESFLSIDIPKSDALERVSKLDGLLGCLERIATIEAPSVQQANLSTSIIYVLHTLSGNFSNGTWSTKPLEAKILTLLAGAACSSYAAHVPLPERKPFLPERSLRLMVHFAKLEPRFQKVFADLFETTTAPALVRFYAFPRTLDLFLAYITQLNSWGVLSLESAATSLKKAVENADPEFDAPAKEVLGAFVSRISSESS